jgi:hypothetical protein
MLGKLESKGALSFVIRVRLCAQPGLQLNKHVIVILNGKLLSEERSIPVYSRMFLTASLKLPKA